MTADRDHGPVTPAYLRGVLTVEAEMADGSTGPDGWMRTASISPVLMALSYAGGAASLVTEDANGHLTRLRVPGQTFLRLIGGADAGHLTRAVRGTQTTPPARPVTQDPGGAGQRCATRGRRYRQNPGRAPPAQHRLDPAAPGHGRAVAARIAVPPRRPAADDACKVMSRLGCSGAARGNVAGPPHT